MEWTPRRLFKYHIQHGRYADMEAELNELGQSGWEIVSFEQEGGHYWALLKKSIDV